MVVVFNGILFDLQCTSFKISLKVAAEVVKD